MFLHTCKYFNLKTPFFNVILAFHDEIVCAHNIFLPSFHTYFTFQTAVQSHVLRATLPQAFSCLTFQTASLRYARRNAMTTCQLPPDYRFTTYHKPYTTNLMINNDHNIPLPTDGMQHTHPIKRCAGIMNRTVILPSHEYFPNKSIV